MKNYTKPAAFAENKYRKQINLFLSAISIIITLVVAGCLKTDITIPQSDIDPFEFTWPSYPVTCEPKDLKLSVLEYGTNQPISHAELKMYRCDEPDLFYCLKKSLIVTHETDANGKFYIKKSDFPNDFYSAAISKENYWTAFGDACSFGADTTISTGAQDSAIVKLFSYSWLKIHLKNQNQYAVADSLKFLVNAIKDNGKSISVNPPFTYSLMANNTDTTFIYPTYGNIKNELTAVLNSVDIVFNKTIFISKNDTLQVEVRY